MSQTAANENAINAPPGIYKPGIYNISHEQYHSDPCAVPSLSCSIAKLLIRQTPRHAWQAHARFGAKSIVPTAAMDDGSTVHAMLLGQGHLIEPIRTVFGPKTTRKEMIGKPVDNYQTKDAQEERDEIRGMGRIPVFQHRLIELIRCKTAALTQIEQAEDGCGFLEAGSNEVCLISREDDVLLRCLVDRLPDDCTLPPYDLKLTEMSAAPGGWERRLQTEYAFQDAFYRRVIRGARGIEPPPMRFITIELDPPHGLVINAAAASLRAIAEAEVERAVQLWRQCMRTGLWPLYPGRTNWVEATGWQTDDEARKQEGSPATFGAVRALLAA